MGTGHVTEKSEAGERPRNRRRIIEGALQPTGYVGLSRASRSAVAVALPLITARCRSVFSGTEVKHASVRKSGETQEKTITMM